jgi:hypothetical protein
MPKRIKEITAENFSAAVDYACDLNRRMHACILARKIILPLGSLVFALNVFFLFMGLFFSV